MADSKITALTALTAADPANDMIPIVDVSDTPPASGNTKRISINNLLACSPSATLASATITGDLTVDTSTLKVDSTNNRVGILTASPTHSLDVRGIIKSNGTFTAYINPSFSGAAAIQTESAESLILAPSGQESLRCAPSGVYTFGNGAGGTLMTLNSSVLAIGVTPNTWTVYKALQVQGASIFSTTGNDTGFGSNVYYDGGYKFRSASSDKATRYEQFGGSHSWHYTAAAGTAGNTATFTQAMTLDASGRLLVGLTTSTGDFKFEVSGTNATNSYSAKFSGGSSTSNGLNFYLPGTRSSDTTYYLQRYGDDVATRFQIFGNGNVQNTTGTYGTISDLRLKENISDARNYLTDLLKLRVVKYSLKADGSPTANLLGLIAQEVEQVFPTLVETSGDDVKSVKTTVLIPMLLKAIQELTARVQTLEAR